MDEDRVQQIIAVLLFPILIGVPLLCTALFHLLFPNGSLSRFNILIFLYLLFSIAAPFVLPFILYGLLLSIGSNRNKNSNIKRREETRKIISIRKLRIAIFGSGRIGSRVASKLVKVGARDMINIDGDYVSESNLEIPGMVFYEQHHLYVNKPLALYDVLRRYAFDIEFKPVIEMIDESTSDKRLEDILQGVKICVVAIDSRSGLRRLSNFLTPRIPTVYGGMTSGGGGFLVFTLPEYRTPCFLHSMGMKSYNEIQELEARRTNITVRDAEAVSHWMARITRLLSIWHTDKNSVFMRINNRRSNLLLLEKAPDSSYNPVWLRPAKDYNCPLCGS